MFRVGLRVAIFGVLLSAPWAMVNATEKTIEVAGVGAVNYVPDTFSFRVQLEARGKQVGLIKSQIAADSTKAIDALIGVGLAPNAIQALNIQFNPWIEYKREGNEHKGFILRQEINVSVDSLALYEKAIDTLLAHNINRLDGFNASSSNNVADYQKALNQALLNAQQTAKNMAGTLGLEVKGVQNIIEQSSSPVKSATRLRAQNMAESSFMPGVGKTEARVKVTFTLK